MVPFAGYEMPVQYTSVLDETMSVRSDAGLFDVSHMGQFSVRGKNALAAVNSLVTNDLTKIAVGQAQYNMLCNDHGGVIDDLVVYRLGEEEIYICVNASNRKADFDWFTQRLPKDGVTFEDQSDETALLAIQGPKAEAILGRAASPDALKAIKYYWAARLPVFGKQALVSRTGYTGEDGFEIYLPAKDAASAWENLLELGRKDGLVPVGLGARDTLRTEMGYPLHGHELSPEITPLAAGLAWVVKLDKEADFPGKAALKAEKERGPSRVLKALLVSDRRIARPGYRILDDSSRVVGQITSGTMSPHLNQPIALGFIAKEAAQAGGFFLEVRESHIAAQVVKLPFVPSHTKSNKV